MQSIFIFLYIANLIISGEKMQNSRGVSRDLYIFKSFLGKV